MLFSAVVSGVQKSLMNFWLESISGFDFHLLDLLCPHTLGLGGGGSIPSLIGDLHIGFDTDLFVKILGTLGLKNYMIVPFSCRVSKLGLGRIDPSIYIYN